jgi:hypothetical protein
MRGYSLIPSSGIGANIFFCLQIANKRRTVRGYSLIPSSGIRATFCL